MPNLPFLLFQIKLQFDYQDFLLISTGFFFIFNHTEVHAQDNFSCYRFISVYQKLVHFYSLSIFLSWYCWKPNLKISPLKLDSFHDISKNKIAQFFTSTRTFFSSKQIFIRSLTFSLVYLISKIIAVYQNSSGLVFCQHFFFYKSNTPIFCDYSSHLFCERVPCVAAIVLMLSAFFFSRKLHKFIIFTSKFMGSIHFYCSNTKKKKIY